MIDTLRDRIKDEVLDGILSMFSENDSVEMAAGYIADAIIRQLGLERETWNPDMGVSVLPRHMWVKPTPVYRYVTDWVQTND